MGRVRVFIIDAGGGEREVDACMLEHIQRGRCPLCGGKLEVLCSEPEIGYMSWACHNCRSLIYTTTENRD